MDSEFKWIAGVFLVFFGIVFGALVYSDHLGHIEKMECMKLQGEWVGKTCIFRR